LSQYQLGTVALDVTASVSFAASSYHDDCIGCLPGFAAVSASTGIGSDTQKPFAIVIVAGLISRLFIGFFVNPALHLMVAKDGDVLQV
jgi:hypothetical protein